MKRRAFTLLELMVVVIIVGILAMIAMPQFFKAAEKARAAEGVNILGALRGAQLRYYSENPKQAFTDDLTELDVGFNDADYKFFTALRPFAASATDPDAILGEIIRREIGYKLSIKVNGNIVCDDDAKCPSGFKGN